MKEPRILPECHADTLLAEIAGFKANHQPNINEVAKSMEVNFKGSLAIGIVDDDNRIPNYFKNFVALNTDYGFILKKHPERKHYLIVLSPAFEKWVFKAAEISGVDPSKFTFREMDYFKKCAKDRLVHKNKEVRSFLNAITQKPGNPISEIGQWIEDILTKE